MPTVKLIVTGQTENVALAPALNHIFKDISFSCELAQSGITSHCIRMEQAPKPDTLPNTDRNVDKLAKALVAAVYPEYKNQPNYDMAIVIDDLELENLHQPQIVMDFFTEAVNHVLKH